MAKRAKPARRSVVSVQVEQVPIEPRSVVIARVAEDICTFANGSCFCALHGRALCETVMKRSLWICSQVEAHFQMRTAAGDA